MTKSLPTTASALAAAILLATGTCFAQSGSSQSDGPANKSSSSASHPQSGQSQSPHGHQQTPSQIHLTSARNLIDRDIHDKQGNNAGKVKYVMVDLANGDVRYILIGSSGGFDIGNQFVAVPWSAINTSQRSDNALNLNVTADRLKQAPRLSEERLSELTGPQLFTEVYSYYLTPISQGQQKQQGQPGQSGQDKQQGQPGQSGQSSQQAQSSQGSQQAQSGQDKQQGQSSQASQQTGKPKQSAQGQQSGQGGNQPQILIGRELITVLAPPNLVSSQQVTGTQVRDTNGQEVGEIDRLMIDTDHGHVAYVLLEKGGFLGLGSDWIPVPFESLSWSGSGQYFTLNIPESQLKNVKTVPKGNVPTEAKASDLRNLYSQYGVTPYWEKMQEDQQSRQGQQGQQSS